MTEAPEPPLPAYTSIAMTSSLRWFAALLAAALPAAGAASCDSKSGAGAPNAAGSSSAASATASATPPATSAELSEGDDQVRPVYPVTKDPPLPLAQKL